MAENGAEHSHIKRSAITQADHCLGIDLVSKTSAGREIFEVGDNRATERDAIFPCNVDLTVIKVEPPALIFSGHGLRPVDLPPQTIINSQLGSDVPGVLSVEEKPPLPFPGGLILGDVAVELGSLPHQET